MLSEKKDDVSKKLRMEKPTEGQQNSEDELYVKKMDLLT
jgi:hypothetical protein